MNGRKALGVGPVFHGWLTTPNPKLPYVIGVSSGEGIGPEVVAAALDVLAALQGLGSASFDVRFGPRQDEAAGESSSFLSEVEVEFCRSIFEDGGALFCGPRGGRFVYDLRERFDLYCKLTPVKPLEPLCGVGAVREGTACLADLLLVRENVGGLYFGSQHERREGGVLREVSHAFGYRREAVDRIVGVAAQLATVRGDHLTVVVKSGGVPSISAMWREVAESAQAVLDVECHVLDVDNVCYQIVADPTRFGVVVSPNMFGDVLADVSALLLGSRGVSFSANFGDDRKAVYQTAHGGALDIAGRDVANPVGQILSLAFMLEESFGLTDLAGAVRSGTEQVLADGWRTADVAIAGCETVGTRELGKRIAERVHVIGSELREMV